MSHDPFRERIESHDGSYPDYWKPTEGEVLIGEILRFEKGYAKHRGEVDIVVVANENTGELVSVWCIPFLLSKGFRQTRPRIGERVGIKYLGMVESDKGGEPYHNFHVEVDRRDGTSPTPWDDPAPQEAAPPPPTQAPIAPVGAPVRDDFVNMRGDFDRKCQALRAERWMISALALAHPQLPDDVKEWRSDDFRLGIALLKRWNSQAFYKAAEKLAQDFPPDPKDLELIAQELDLGTVSQKDKLRIDEAVNTGWNDAVMWALEECQRLNRGENASDEAPSISRAPSGAGGVDDDLPFFRFE